MIRFILTFIMIMVPLVAIAPPEDLLNIIESKPINPFEKIWTAVCDVESEFDSLAYNPLEEATGIAQIRPCKLFDYNYSTGANYALNDCYSPQISKQIFMYFADQIGPYELDKIVMRWNGSGPMTLDYLKRVKEKL
jgi:hypothetical protein